MEEQLLFTYWDIYGKGISQKHLDNHKEQLIFDTYNRTLLTQGDQIGNHYRGSYHGEIFNDFPHNTATGDYSSASGKCTVASNVAEYAVGRYNKSTKSNAASQSTLFSVGYGTTESERKNAFEIKHNGVAYFTRETYIGNMPVWSYVSNSYAYTLENTKQSYDSAINYLHSYMASAYNQLYSYATFHQVDVDSSHMISVRNNTNNGESKLFINKTIDGVLFIDIYNKLTASLQQSRSQAEYDSDSATVRLSVNMSNGLAQTNIANLTGDYVPAITTLRASGTFGDVVVPTNVNTSWKLTYSDGKDTNNLTDTKYFSWLYAFLYGTVEPTPNNFKTYSSRKLATTISGQTLAINQKAGEYAWVALPANWSQPKFTDTSIGIEGGWIKQSDFISPYSNKLKYNVYRTANHSLGNITWKITV